MTGGYVYRGSAHPGARGGYVFADYCSGEIWVVDAAAPRRTGAEDAAPRHAHQISGFGENKAGELYVLEPRRAMYAIVQG